VPPRLAWLLNFDADTELARPGAVTPSEARRARMIELVDSVRGLLGEGDIVLEGAAPNAATRYIGNAFCPTPSAVRRLQAMGAKLPPFPTLDVLRRVNHRRFSIDLGPTLPGTIELQNDAQLRDALQRRSPNGYWLLKRPFGFSGQGQLRVGEGSVPEVAAAFVKNIFREGESLWMEPYQNRTLDVSLHGYLSLENELTLGDPVISEIDERGAWKQSRRADQGELTMEEGVALEDAATRGAKALRRAGYFGPFGIDAFRYRGEGGARAFHPCCEINGRYTMAWALGMGRKRPDRAALIAQVR
jgi:hypothetical protein